MRVIAISAAVIALVGSLACGGATARAPETAPTSQQLAELWIDPGSQPRDLFLGVGGEEFAPPKDPVFRFKARDETGFSVSYDVIAPDGTEWSAKIGP